MHLDREIQQLLTGSAGVSTPRERAEVWKNSSVDQLQSALEGLQAARTAFGGASSAAKAVIQGVCQGGKRIAKAVDQSLNEEDDNYYADADLLSALEEVRPPAADEIKDDIQQGVAAINNMIKTLNGVLAAVLQVKL